MQPFLHSPVMLLVAATPVLLPSCGSDHQGPSMSACPREVVLQVESEGAPTGVPGIGPLEVRQLVVAHLARAGVAWRDQEAGPRASWLKVWIGWETRAPRFHDVRIGVLLTPGPPTGGPSGAYYQRLYATTDPTTIPAHLQRLLHSTLQEALTGNPPDVPNPALGLPAQPLKVKVRPPDPPYPAPARDLGIQGTVVVDLIVDQEGLPCEAEVNQGPPVLQDTALAFACGWEFEPVQMDGVFQKARFRITVPFRLR